MKTAVLTDSTCDLDEQQADALGIQVIPLNIYFDGRQWLDRQELSSPELFRRVARGAAMPSTAPPTLEAYHARLDGLLGRADHVFALHLSSKLSETYAVATEAARAFPGRVTVHDTWNSSGALALQAERATRLLGEGVSPTLLSAALGSLRAGVHTHMCLSTLTYLQKNGRIGGAQALLGGLMNLRPIVGLQGGQVEAFARPAGQRRAIRHMQELLRGYAHHTPQARVALFHNGHPEGVEALQYEARQLGLHSFLTLELGTVLSAHGGPGVFGFSFEPKIVWHDFKPY